MTLRELENRVERLLEDAGCRQEVLIETKILADVDRLELTRSLRDCSRYLRITPVAVQGVPWNFEILGGVFGHSDEKKNFDGRRGGNGPSTLSLIEDWLVRLIDWNELPFGEKPAL